MTAYTVCHQCCDGVRIYPTVVFPDTALMRMKNEGLYFPLTNAEAIERTAKVIEVFSRFPIKIIRIGLCANETLAGSEFTNNYHPSIGELSLNRFYRNKMTSLLVEIKPNENSVAVFTVAMGKISQAVGQKKENVNYLKERFALKDVKVKEAYMPNAFSLSVDIH